MSYISENTTDGITRLTIRREERRNSLGPTIAGELLSALKDLAMKLQQPHPNCRVLVLTAAPVMTDKHTIWVAGGDLKELQSLHKDAAASYMTTMTEVCQTLNELPVPVILAIDGLCIGGGVELAMCGDFRLATQSTRWQFKQHKLSLTTGYGSTHRLVELVGLSTATELLMLQTTLTADELKALKLVQQVVANAEELNEAVHKLCQQLMTTPRPVLSGQKKTLLAAGELDRAAARTLEGSVFVQLWGSDEHIKATAAALKPTGSPP